MEGDWGVGDLMTAAGTSKRRLFTFIITPLSSTDVPHGKDPINESWSSVTTISLSDGAGEGGR